MDDDRDMTGWDLRGVRFYAHGLLILLTFNVLVLIAEKPVPTDVWLWLNGFGLVLTLLGAHLLRRFASD